MLMPARAVRGASLVILHLDCADDKGLATDSSIAVKPDCLAEIMEQG
jgi:hypothetical protein